MEYLIYMTKNNLLYTDLTTDEKGKIVIENLIPGKILFRRNCSTRGIF